MTPEEQNKQVTKGLTRTIIAESTGYLLAKSLLQSAKKSKALRFVLAGLVFVMVSFGYFLYTQW